MLLRNRRPPKWRASHAIPLKSSKSSADNWRVPNPPGANPLLAERAFPKSDHWGRTGVARCAEEMRQESVGISNRLLTPCHTRLRRPPRGPFSYQGVSTRGVRHSPGENVGACMLKGQTLKKTRTLLSAEPNSPWKISKEGSSPTSWARGLRDQIQKWALQTQKTHYF